VSAQHVSHCVVQRHVANRRYNLAARAQLANLQSEDCASLADQFLELGLSVTQLAQLALGRGQRVR
jgi:hypothetical protein